MKPYRVALASLVVGAVCGLSGPDAWPIALAPGVALLVVAARLRRVRLAVAVVGLCFVALGAYGLERLA